MTRSWHADGREDGGDLTNMNGTRSPTHSCPAVRRLLGAHATGARSPEDRRGFAGRARRTAKREAQRANGTRPARRSPVSRRLSTAFTATPGCSSRATGSSCVRRRSRATWSTGTTTPSARLATRQLGAFVTFSSERAASPRDEHRNSPLHARPRPAIHPAIAMPSRAREGLAGSCRRRSPRARLQLPRVPQGDMGGSRCTSSITLSPTDYSSRPAGMRARLPRQRAGGKVVGVTLVQPPAAALTFARRRSPPNGGTGRADAAHGTRRTARLAPANFVYSSVPDGAYARTDDSRPFGRRDFVVSTRPYRRASALPT